jgi:hypothetical protein
VRWRANGSSPRPTTKRAPRGLRRRSREAARVDARVVHKSPLVAAVCFAVLVPGPGVNATRASRTRRVVRDLAPVARGGRSSHHALQTNGPRVVLRPNARLRPEPNSPKPKRTTPAGRTGAMRLRGQLGSLRGQGVRPSVPSRKAHRASRACHPQGTGPPSGWTPDESRCPRAQGCRSRVDLGAVQSACLDSWELAPLAWDRVGDSAGSSRRVKGRGLSGTSPTPSSRFVSLAHAIARWLPDARSATARTRAVNAFTAPPRPRSSARVRRSRLQSPCSFRRSSRSPRRAVRRTHTTPCPTRGRR